MIALLVAAVLQILLPRVAAAADAAPATASSEAPASTTAPSGASAPATTSSDGSAPATESQPPAAPTFLDENPTLQKFVYREPETHFYFGFGASPITVFHNRFGFAVSVFQIHFMSPLLDWEIFNASFGFTLADQNGIAGRTYTFRTVPKWRLGRTLSIGPLLGYEFVSFPSVTAYLEKGLFTPVSYPFSASGPIYGFAISENFDAGTQYKFKINELAYRQNYSTTGTSNGWKYYYDQTSLNADQSPIAAGWVFAFEFSFLY